MALDHEQRRPQDGAVDGDQRQEDAHRRVQMREEPIEHHLDNLHRGGDGPDIGEEPQKRQVVLGEAGIDPGERPGPKQVRVDQVVHRHRYGEYEDHRHPQPDCGFHPLGDRQKRAPPQEERPGHVLDEERLDR